MPEGLAISLQGVGKTYYLYRSALEQSLDALGLRKLLGRRQLPIAFEALKDVNLDVSRGAQLGIIGRNGAGKTTLLKLITRNFRPTVGSVRVTGRVQALLETGLGFHPEFTGFEN